MTTDVHCWVGEYPYRTLPALSADALVRDLDALEIEQAWVGHLPAAFGLDSGESNRVLTMELAPHGGRVRAVPSIHPAQAGWRDELDRAAGVGAAAVRMYPAQWELLGATGPLDEAVAAAGASGLAVCLTVQFEDIRQRDLRDNAPSLDGASVRRLARASDDARLIVAAAGRSLIEEVHWGLTPAEAQRVWWEISHVWGPYERDLSHLLATVGSDRFVFGTHWPLRIRDAALAKLGFLTEVDDVRRVRSANAERLQAG